MLSDDLRRLRDTAGVSADTVDLIAAMEAQLAAAKREAQINWLRAKVLTNGPYGDYRVYFDRLKAMGEELREVSPEPYPEVEHG